MFEVRKGEDHALFVRMVSSADGSPLSGASLTFKACRTNESAMAPYTPSSVISVGDGWYQVVIPGVDLDVAGEMAIDAYATGADVFPTKIHIVDPATNLQYLDDTTIARIASAVLTTKAADARANSYCTLPPPPHPDYRETLIAAIHRSGGGWGQAGGGWNIRDSSGAVIFSLTNDGTVSADQAVLSTGIS